MPKTIHQKLNSIAALSKVHWGLSSIAAVTSSGTALSQKFRHSGAQRQRCTERLCRVVQAKAHRTTLLSRRLPADLP